MKNQTVPNDPDRTLVIAACIHRPFLERPDDHPEHVRTVVRYFIAKRPYGGELGGKWEMPGGKVRDVETVYSALVREINEELGWSDIVPEELVIPHRADVDFSYGKFRVLFATIEVGVELEDVPMLIEHLGFLWSTLFELKDAVLHDRLTPATASMVKFLLAETNRPE